MIPLLGVSLEEMLVQMAMGEGGSSEPAETGYLYTYQNGVFDAQDDGYDGYYEADVWVDPEPIIGTVKATSNGTYSASDYGLDAINPAVVSVGEDFDFCDKPDIDDITPYIDEEYYVYDKTAGFGLSCEIEENGRRLRVYKVYSNGWKQQVYSNVTDLTYGNAYLTVVDSSTGQFRIYYTFTYSPGTWRTINRTNNTIIGYGASGHRFTATKK